MDLVVAAQALHWFDLDTFYAHVRGVMCNPGGVIAAWPFGASSVTPAVDAVLRTFYAVIFTDWAPQIQYVVDRYETIPFPFSPVSSANLTTTGPFPFACAKEVTLAEFLMHLRLFSAVQKAIDFRARRGANINRSLPMFGEIRFTEQ